MICSQTGDTEPNYLVPRVVKDDLSCDGISEIPQKSLLSDSFSSAQYAQNSKVSSKPEIKNLRNERIMTRMSRSEANSPRPEYSRNHCTNLSNLNKFLQNLVNLESERLPTSKPELQQAGSLKSIEDLENRWDQIKKQHNFHVRTSLSPNRYASASSKHDSFKQATSQTDLDNKVGYDSSRRGTNEKPFVTNLLSKVVPQAKINLVQFNESVSRSRRNTDPASSTDKVKSKSPLQAIYDKYNSIHRTELYNTESGNQTPDSRSKSPPNNSLEGLSSSFQSLIQDQKKPKYLNYAKSKSPPSYEQRRRHSPSLHQYRALMKQTLKDNFCSEMRNFEEIKSKRSQQSDEKHSYNKQGVDEGIPEREGHSKQEPRESTPVKKLKSKLVTKIAPDSSRNSPHSAVESSRSLDVAKLNLGITRDAVHIRHENDRLFNFGTTGNLKKNSPNYFSKPISPSRNIFSKGTRPLTTEATEEQGNTSADQNLLSHSTHKTGFSLSPLRANNGSANLVVLLRGKSKEMRNGVSDPTQNLKTDTEGSLKPDTKQATKPTITKIKQASLLKKKSEERKKVKKAPKPMQYKSTKSNPRTLLHTESGQGEQQNLSNVSKDCDSYASKPTSHLRSNHPSRREERERYQYVLNSLSTNDCKRDSANVSFERGVCANIVPEQMQQYPPATHAAAGNFPSQANTPPDNNNFANSLKSSFKSNDNASTTVTKPENSVSKPKKKEQQKEVVKPQKFYYLPKNDENAQFTYTKPQELNAKATVAKLIKNAHQKYKR